MIDQQVDPFVEEFYFSAVHESAHAVCGRALGMTVERIFIDPRGARGGSRVFFSNVPDHASMIVVAYAAGIAQAKAGDTYRSDGEDIKLIAKRAEQAGFQKHHLAALKRMATRLVDLYAEAIYSLALQLHVRGVYKFSKGGRLIFVGGAR